MQPPQRSLAESLGIAVASPRAPDAPRALEDEGECYVAARDETGVDPLGIGLEETDPADVTQAKTESQGLVSRGIGGGALLGAGLSRAWRGAVRQGQARGSAVGRVPVGRSPVTSGGMVGGSVGALVSGAKEQVAQNREEAESEEEAREFTRQRAAFTHQFGACLQARGYTVR